MANPADVPLAPATFGTAIEHLAIHELLSRGFSVAVPVVDDGVDLVVDYRLRVQVKATRTEYSLEVKPGFRYPALSWSAGRGGWVGADVFLLYCPGRWFVVPAEVLRGHSSALTMYPGSTRGTSHEIAAHEDAWHVLKTLGPSG